MRLQEIDNKYASNLAAIRELQKQVAELSRENNRLSAEKEEKRMKYFSEWIEIGQKYSVNSYMWMSGTLTGVKAGETNSIDANPQLQQGDEFEFVKKNEKSFVIKVTTKLKNKRVNGQIVEQVLHPNWTYRVVFGEVYTYMMRDQSMKQSFETFILRKEALDLLGI